MENNPYDAPPAADAAAVPYNSNTRPTSATVFGILNLVFGTMGICGGIAGGISMVILASGEFSAEIGPASGLSDPVFMGYTIFQTIVSVILAVMLLFSGIGLLKFVPWGRTLAIYYAIPSLFMLVLGLGMNIVYTLLPALRAADNMADAEATGMIFGAVGGLVGGIVGAIYPILLLVFMNRKSFRDAIQAAGGQ